MSAEAEREALESLPIRQRDGRVAEVLRFMEARGYTITAPGAARPATVSEEAVEAAWTELNAVGVASGLKTGGKRERDIVRNALAAALPLLTAQPEADDVKEFPHDYGWHDLMALLDEHWPDDVFPTLEDDTKRDAGARIVSLIRWVDRLRAQPEAEVRAESVVKAEALEEAARALWDSPDSLPGGDTEPVRRWLERRAAAIARTAPAADGSEERSDG